ncbi:MAG: hypothetical protein QF420_00085 [Alphaproteobacteria bacterium]|nr:hypothetical protein [Alphaproteobacteria bacterium]
MVDGIENNKQGKKDNEKYKHHKQDLHMFAGTILETSKAFDLLLA